MMTDTTRIRLAKARLDSIAKSFEALESERLALLALLLELEGAATEPEAVAP
jgi:hypothetical protein